MKKAYDPLQKRGAFGQVLAIGCVHLCPFCLPIGFCVVEGRRIEGFISPISSLPFLPDNLTLLFDGLIMSKNLVEWFKGKGWELIGVIRRNMLFSYRGKEGKVEDLVEKAKVVTVKRWGIKVLCVPFERKRGKVYYLACTCYKLPAEKVKRSYLKRTGIEVFIRVLKQEKGLRKRLVILISAKYVVFPTPPATRDRRSLRPPPPAAPNTSLRLHSLPPANPKASQRCDWPASLSSLSTPALWVQLRTGLR